VEEELCGVFGMKQLLSSQLLPRGRQQQRQQHLLLQSPHPPCPPGNRLPSATPKLWEKTKIRRCSFFSSGCYGAAFQAPMIFSPLLFSRLPFCLLAAVVAFFSAFVVFMFRVFVACSKMVFDEGRLLLLLEDDGGQDPIPVFVVVSVVASSSRWQQQQENGIDHEAPNQVF
jgi:hypothetical protein